MKLRLSVVLIALQASAAQAASVSTTLAVQAQVLQSGACSVGATAVNFGQILPGQLNQYGEGSISITCSVNQPYQYSLNGGEHYDAPNRNRRLASGGNLEIYVLYTGSYADLISFPANEFHGGNGNGQAQRIDLLAKLFTTAQTPAGSYADNVLVTVNY
jgi:spore coat protein U-like protein